MSITVQPRNQLNPIPILSGIPHSLTVRDVDEGHAVLSHPRTPPCPIHRAFDSAVSGYRQSRSPSATLLVDANHNRDHRPLMSGDNFRDGTLVARNPHSFLDPNLATEKAMLAPVMRLEHEAL